MSLSPWLVTTYYGVMFNVLVFINVLTANTCETGSLVNTHFAQIANCPVDYRLSCDIQINATGSLDCARTCAESHTCWSFHYHPASQNSTVPSYNCGLCYERVTYCTELGYAPGFKHYQKSTPSCRKPWKLVFSQQMGSVKSGSLSSLTHSIQQGSPVRILIEGDLSNNNTLQLYNVDSAWIINGTVVAQIFTFFFYLINGSAEPVWTKLQASTLGVVSFVSHDQDGAQQYLANIRWFIKETEVQCPRSSSTVLKMDQTGTIHQGSVDDMLSAIKEGFPIQMVEERGLNEWRSIPVLNSFIDEEQLQAFYLYGVWTDASLQSSSLVSEMVLFQNKPTFTLVSFPNLDIMNASTSSGMVYRDAILSWAVDYCWEKVYVHDEYGYPEYGSYRDLTDRINGGSDIRVVYQCADSTSVEALGIDQVSEYGGVVTAYTANSFTFPFGQPFNWIRKSIHSNGTVTEITLDRSDGTESWNPCQARISWFADKTERNALWFYHDEYMIDAADYISYPMEIFYKGIMPRIFVIREIDGIASTYNLQKMTYVPYGTDTIIIGMNNRVFNKSSLAVHYFDANHTFSQHNLNVDVSPGSIHETFSVRPYEITWWI